MKRRTLALLLGVSLAAIVVARLAAGWSSVSHETITEAAVARLPDDVPVFFRKGGKELAYFARDPDRWRNRELEFLRRSEEPNHYLDSEELDGKSLPATGRFDALKIICADLKKEPVKVGLLPYAIMEQYEKLVLGFADYRKSPTNPAIPMKCLVYGGTMAHYTEDSSMPLHTTRDYDGINKPDGTVKYKGIHAKIDSFPELNAFKPEEICRNLEPKKIDDVWKHVNKFIEESYTHIQKCYELHAAGAIDKPTDESRAFIMARVRAGTQLTLDLWYTAWVRSEKLNAR
jgi:hypothetical protein